MPTLSPARPRANRFPGKCADCGGWIEAEAGAIAKVRGRWVVNHIGTCPPPQARPERPARPALPDVPAGYYALPDPTGRNDLRFYRVDRPTEGRWAGYTFLKVVIGGQPDRRVPREDVPGILAEIAADPDAGFRYGREIGRCCACNRQLTDEESRRLGIGPDCRKALGCGC